MKLDYLTLFATFGLIDITIVVILLYYIMIVRTKKWYIIAYVGYKLLETISLVGFGLRGEIPDLLSVHLSNAVFLLSIFLHQISIVSYSGQFQKKFSISIGIITLASIVSFIILVDDERTRTIIISCFVSVLYLFGGVNLYTNRQHYKLPILLSLSFLYYSLINLLRAYSIYQVTGEYQFIDLLAWDTLLILSGVVTILISSFGFILLLKEVDEHTIFKQNRLTSIAFTESPVSIVLTDPEANIEFVNPKFSELTGYSLEQAKGNNTNILKTELTPNETFESLWSTISSGNTWSGEFINKKKNGETYYEEAVITPIHNAKKEIINYLAIKIDITNRKLNEKLVEERNRELQEINHTKDKLFSIIGHDLKGPIGNLKQLLELIKEDIDNGDKEGVHRIIKMSKETADNSFDILENLLSWSRSQLNVIQPNKELIDLHPIIEEAYQLYHSSAQQKKIELSYHPKEDMEVLADKDMISVVIRNLISNSIKFTASHGKVTIDVADDQNDIIISVKDTGVGIDADRQSKVFNFAENRSTRGTSGEKGTGLGLVLAREFIIKNNGKIWVNSKPGEGCIFYISLPKQNI